MSFNVKARSTAFHRRQPRSDAKVINPMASEAQTRYQQLCVFKKLAAVYLKNKVIVIHILCQVNENYTKSPRGTTWATK